MKDTDGPVSRTRLVIGCVLIALLSAAFVITSGWKDVDALWRFFGR